MRLKKLWNRLVLWSVGDEIRLQRAALARCEAEKVQLERRMTEILATIRRMEGVQARVIGDEGGQGK